MKINRQTVKISVINNNKTTKNTRIKRTDVFQERYLLYVTCYFFVFFLRQKINPVFKRTEEFRLYIHLSTLWYMTAHNFRNKITCILLLSLLWRGLLRKIEMRVITSERKESGVNGSVTRETFFRRTKSYQVSSRRERNDGKKTK